jgi:hypothetical protein
VTGPLAQRRQRRRRRNTPNTNTTTTTTISTHNHVSMAASLVGAGAGRGDATAAHPSKQLGHGQATSGPGSTAALRTGSRDPCTRRRVGPLRPSPSGHAQAAQPTVSTSTTRAEDPGRRHPPQRDHSDPTGGDGGAEKRLPCLGGGTIQAWLC